MWTAVIEVLLKSSRNSSRHFDFPPVLIYSALGTATTIFCFEGIIVDALSYCTMSLLHTGLRRTKSDGQYSGPARQSGVRFISKASLTLESIYEQNRLSMQKRDGGKLGTKIPDPAPGPAAKGKPRLLLMGQRR